MFIGDNTFLVVKEVNRSNGTIRLAIKAPVDLRIFRGNCLSDTERSAIKKKTEG